MTAVESRDCATSSAIWSESNIGVLNYLGLFGDSARPFQYGSDANDDLFEAERLGDVVVSTDGET